MLRSTMGPLCPACRWATRPARRVQLAMLTPTPFLPARWASAQRQRRKTPSRMVLSDTVARPPAARQPARRKQEGPFAGMNRTVANVREKPAPATTTTAAAATASTSRHESRRQLDRKEGSRGQAGGSGSGGAKKPFKALRMQQSLATIGYGQRTHIKTRLQELTRFDEFHLLPAVQAAITSDALRGLVDVKPTPIQRLAVPALLGQTVDRRASRQRPPGALREFLLAAETGSGKTLAYLLPVVDALKRAEAADEEILAYNQRREEERQRRARAEAGAAGAAGAGGADAWEPHPTTARPRAVVLVPSAELVAQVGAVAKALSHAVKFKTELLSANVPARAMARNLHSPAGIDLVVATPHLLASVAEAEPNVLSRVTHLVVDEADSLLDRSFAPATTALLERARPSLQQLVLCSATIPRRLDAYLAAHFPHMQRITTPNLHAIPRRVQLGVLDVAKDPYRNNKNLACADAIWSIGKDAGAGAGAAGDDGPADVKRIMVFVNEREKTQEVADFLRSKGIDAVALHRDAAEHRHHAEMLAQFTRAEPLKATDAQASSAAAVAPPPRGPGGRTLPNTKVIVATDLASRGIDTLGVRHVVLYDVPHTTIDFIHRLGRAGRMGRRGRGIVLVGKDDRRDIVAEVRESMYMGQALV